MESIIKQRCVLKLKSKRHSELLLTTNLCIYISFPGGYDFYYNKVPLTTDIHPFLATSLSKSTNRTMKIRYADYAVKSLVVFT